ncbi:hypothetical protein HX793_29810 [Pseudomonas reactans]|nr:hypothetical protein [Pseudomonas reactans]
MKERPILFSAPMVRAILEGRKTVTRRTMKVQPVLKGNFWEVYGAGWGKDVTNVPAVPGHSLSYNCPYGKPGDRLWVRETWYCNHSEVQKGPYLQPADMADLDQAREDGDLVYAADGLEPYEQEQPTWKPSIHTPRWVSRILLEITDVRVERLQDISDDQAKAEGCFFTDYGQQCFRGGTGWKDVGDCPTQAGHQQRNGWAWEKTTSHEQCLFTPRFAFANLWNATGGEWDANPWVWVVEFKRVTP